MLKFDPTLYHYASRRNTVYAKNGMVCTSQPLAAQAGLDILRKGGNAIDAAIAAATALTVVECYCNGIGGDAFALVWTGGKLHGLNASGPSPMRISAQAVRDMGYEQMPKFGFIPVNVPGAPSAWAELSERFGRLPLTTVMESAICYAREGHPVAVTNGVGWGRAAQRYREQEGEEFKYWFETFAPGGEVPRPGQVWKCEAMADSLESIARTKARSFYEGDLMEKIVAFSDQYGGFFAPSDFENYKPEWVEPISMEYRGYRVHEIPPNGQGISALMALNILKGFDLEPERETAENYHLQIEAIKLGMTDAAKYVTDPRSMSVTVEDLLSPEFAAERRKLIGHNAIDPVPGNIQKGGTVYLCAADGEGNMISYIQSNYMGFGSGLVVPGTGIALQNRGNNFSLDPNHDNVLAGGKKPYHTIIPAFMTKDGQPVGPFGVMGGFMQPQGHLQMTVNTVDFGMNPQDSLDAPRFQWMGSGRKLDLEDRVPDAIKQELADRGHEVRVISDYGSMGKGEIIWKMGDVLCGGCEPRADGTVASY